MTTEGPPAKVRLTEGLGVVDEATKACTRCGEVKPLAEYAADKRAKTGTQSACKHCQAVIRKARRDKDHAAAKAWREKNATKVRAKKQEYRQATKPKIRQLERARYWKDPDKARKEAAQYRAENYDEVTRRNRERMKDERENLKPRYVAKVLGMKPGEVPPPLLALKTEHLTVLRLLRPLKQQLRKARNESSTDIDRIPGEHGRGSHTGRLAPDRGEQPVGVGPQGNQRHGRGSDGQGPGLDQQQLER